MTNKMYTYQIKCSKVDSRTKFHTAVRVLHKKQRYVTAVKTVNQLNKKTTYNHMILLHNNVHDS
jgi:hypothetical protein